MRASPGVDQGSRSTGLAFAALALILAVVGSGGSPASPSPSLSQTASPNPTVAPTPSPTPSPMPTPTFVATGSMHVARMDATATLLQDGKVLIAGGADMQVVPYDEVVSSAELYDPSTGKFTPTGSMRTARSNATATLLADGRVLIAGGYGSSGNVLASAELYDPTTGKFTPTESMSVARVDASAMLLPDGRVLMLNGGDSRAEVYDPATGKFTRDGSLLNFYDSSAATFLPNGKVLVAGAVALIGPGAELYDPANGKSASISLDLPSGAAAAARNDYDEAPETATLLKDGRVLLCVFDYLVTYDPLTDSFMQPGSISAPAQWNLPTTTLLPDGQVLFAGGRDSSGAAVRSAGLYDPASGFHMIGPMIEARSDQTATLLPDGTVLIAGGIGDEQEAFSSAELLRP